MSTVLTPLDGQSESKPEVIRCSNVFCDQTFPLSKAKAYCSDRCRVNAHQLRREAPGLYRRMGEMHERLREQQRRIEAIEREWLTRR